MNVQAGGCRVAHAVVGSTAPFSTSTEGHYYNYDFGAPSAGTFVDHFLKTEFIQGAIRYTWTHADRGEFYDIIFGSFDYQQWCV